MHTQTKILALAFALAALLCLWQRSQIADLKAEIAGMETAFARAQVCALAANLEVTNTVFAERDHIYAGIKEASVHALTQIAAAIPKEAGVDIDRVLPRTLSDALLLQSAGAHPGSGGDSPSGSPVRPQAAATAASGAGAGHDRAPDGPVAQ